MSKVTRILIAPLDWGLGHATRCIPIINVLNRHDIEVIVAAEGAAASILKKEFPSIVILPLKGYRVKYSRNRWFFFLKLFFQFPRIIAAANHEKKWLTRIVPEHKIDAVISDNRFGMQLENTPCVYVTHQLFIETGNLFINHIAQKIHYHYINKFDECWIPDAAGADNLAGKLSHPVKLPQTPVKYLGILSRFKKIITEKNDTLLILLSGPEPQRTIFENILLSQLQNSTGDVILIRGLPVSTKNLILENKNITVYNHLPAVTLNELVQQSEYIITRCGYSTVMDLATLQKKAILVPTPGQKEQEYLASYLSEKKMFYTCGQKDFVLAKALQESKHFKFIPMNAIAGLDESIVINWVEKLKNAVTALQ